MTKLPQNFMWGGAFAANQFGGGYDKDGRGLSVIDITTGGAHGKAHQTTKSIDPNHYYSNHEGIDSYHCYEEDAALFKEVGSKCLRTSTAWTHIFPSGGEDAPDGEGFAFYDRIFNELITQGIESIVMSPYFEMPFHLAKHYGEFRNREVVDYFVYFVYAVFEGYKDEVTYWVTFDEINNQTDTSSPIFLRTNSGVVLTENDNPEKVLYQVAHHELLTNALTVRFSKEIDLKFKIGAMISHIPICPYSCHPKGMMKAQIASRSRFFFPDVQVGGYYPGYAKKVLAQKGYDVGWQEGDDSILQQDTVDYIGFSYYMSMAVKHDVDTTVENNTVSDGLNRSVENPHITTNDWSWAIDPNGLRYTLDVLYDRYQLPLSIMENGPGVVDKAADGHIYGGYRIEYLKTHTTTMIEVVDQDGVDLTGYTPRGIIDTVSFTASETKKHYGLIYVDRGSDGHGMMEHLKEDSLYRYQQVIASSGDKL